MTHLFSYAEKTLCLPWMKQNTIRGQLSQFILEGPYANLCWLINHEKLFYYKIILIRQGKSLVYP